MSNHDPRVDAYLKKSAAFARPILQHIRARVHASGAAVTETIKWGMPHFMYRDKNLCHIAAFKAHCALGFWHGAQLPIKSKVGERAMGQFGRIESVNDLPNDREFAGLIKAAMKLIETGTPAFVVPKAPAPKTLAVPIDLEKALTTNKQAKKVFDTFSPTHKKEYVNWITEAKRDETRQKRIAQAIEMMAAGKSRNWKYRR